MTPIRERWFSMLANLVYPALPAHAAEAMKPFLPMLRDMPDAAFCRASLEAVVMAPRKMLVPSYDELRRPLVEWWRAHRPQTDALQLPPPTDPGIPTNRAAPSAEEVAGVTRTLTAWRTEQASARAAQAGGAPRQPGPGARHLSPEQLAEARRRAGITINTGKGSAA